MILSLLLSCSSLQSLSSASRSHSRALSVLKSLVYLFQPREHEVAPAFILLKVTLFSHIDLSFRSDVPHSLGWFPWAAIPLFFPNFWTFLATVFLQIPVFPLSPLLTSPKVFSNRQVQEQFFHRLFDILQFFEVLLQLSSFASKGCFNCTAVCTIKI